MAVSVPLTVYAHTVLCLAVLGGSCSSFITQLHFEFSNYTQAEYFTEINLPAALRTGLFFISLLHCIFHRDNNFDNVCVRAHVRHITMCASGYIFSARAHAYAYACCNSKRKINGLFVSCAAERCIKCADLPNERQKLFTGVL